jgi:hypothetical protein
MLSKLTSQNGGILSLKKYRQIVLKKKHIQDLKKAG